MNFTSENLDLLEAVIGNSVKLGPDVAVKLIEDLREARKDTARLELLLDGIESRCVMASLGSKSVANTPWIGFGSNDGWYAISATAESVTCEDGRQAIDAAGKEAS